MVLKITAPISLASIPARLIAMFEASTAMSMRLRSLLARRLLMIPVRR
jgi:hypothetical protein